MSITVNRHITFIDSLQFIKASLDTLTPKLEDNDFNYLKTEFPVDKFEILKRKDAYPYEWVNSTKNLNTQPYLKKNHFYSSLKDGKRDKSNGYISNEQYMHLQNVWNTFNFNTFEDSDNHYFRKDVLLLADVFEKFISVFKSL